MKPKQRTYITLILESVDSNRFTRVASIGSFSPSKVEEFRRHGQRSSLWHAVTAIVDTTYPNDRLIEIQARGAVSVDWEADYQAPALERPAIVGYGPCAGILSYRVA